MLNLTETAQVLHDTLVVCCSEHRVGAMPHAVHRVHLRRTSSQQLKHIVCTGPSEGVRQGLLMLPQLWQQQPF